MFANLVRLALALELAAWLGLGAWLSGHGWGVPLIVTVAIAGAALIRLVFVSVTFGLSWLARCEREPGQRLRPGSALSMVAGEWRAVLANNFLWLPFERGVLRADPPPGPDDRIPVILVHGYFSNRGTLCGLARALEAAGVGPVFVPSLPAVLAPIETFSDHLARVVRQVTESTGQPRAILVCHSMGGLAARACVRDHGSGRIAGLVTLGSPHHGTALAVLGAGHNGRQMRLGSDFLENLAASEGASGPGCAALCVYTVHDNLVAPQDSARLDWARNVPVHGVGHLAMLLDARVHRLVRDEIDRLGARPAP